jgi:cytochrome c-type biogenesis protein
MTYLHKLPIPRPFVTRTALLLALLLATGLLALSWLAISKVPGREALATTAALRADQASELTAGLTQSGYAGDDDQVDVILTTPAFFRLTNRTQEATELGADRFVVFVANESVHYGSLPKQFAPVLRLDGNSLHVPSEVKTLTDAVHHRTSVVVFADVPATLLDGTHTLELLLPETSTGQRTALQWYTPLDYPDAVEQPRALSLGLLFSLAAGLLAALSPCLLQLTAFYLPTLAGVNLDAGSGGTLSAAPVKDLAVERRRVMGTALLFILGFTIPYTLGGALMGAVGQTLAASGLLTPTGPLAMGAGWVMIVMAGVVAYRSRVPLVCKLPLPAAIGRSRRLPFVETFVSGFAIATGCLACFGGAILGVLLVYTGLLGSAALGALAMFIFSLGLAIPFLLAALSLSWVLPLAQKLQRLAPALGLLASVVMLFFGITMATGNFHVVSGWLYQHLPLS